MNLRDVCKTGEEKLIKSGVMDAKIDAWLLLEWITGVSKMEYLLYPNKEITSDQLEKYMESINLRSRKIPLQHITGQQDFMGYTFEVNENVLIPRQDTELLVETALDKIENHMKILDMCTGSGCIVISLCKMTKNQGCQFYGSDISCDALQTARKNATNLEAEVEYYQSDLFESIEGKFDMIVSNPPYIRTSVIAELEEEVKCHDPFIALDGKEDGLFFYKKIIMEAKSHLQDQGWLLFEIGYDQKEAVMKLMEEAGFGEITALKDLAGLDRVVFGRYYYSR